MIFNSQIVKSILESALTCQKDNTFKYVNLRNQDVEQFANNFLAEKPDRGSCVSKEDVYLFLDDSLKAIGYKSTPDGVFISPRVLQDRGLFLEHFNNWIRINPNSDYLIPYCHVTNLELLETLVSTFQTQLDRTLLEKLSLDLQSIIADPSYKNYEKQYEHFIITLLCECTSGYIFSNILKASNNDSLKKQIFDIISCSSNKGAISLEVVSNLGIEHVPSNVLQTYIEFVNPSSVSLDMFLSILNTVPITNFTVSNLDSTNPVFNKYVAFIEHYIQTNAVNEELISKMIQASSPYNQNGWTMLNLLNQACASFSNQNNINTTQVNNVNYTDSDITQQVNNMNVPPMVHQVPMVSPTNENRVPVVNNITTSNIVPTASPNSNTVDSTIDSTICYDYPQDGTSSYTEETNCEIINDENQEDIPNPTNIGPTNTFSFNQNNSQSNPSNLGDYKQYPFGADAENFQPEFC